MSYEMIGYISLKKDKKEVWMRSCANNVCPRKKRLWHCESLSNIWQEQGLEALEVEILKEYSDGNFQGGRGYIKDIYDYFRLRVYNPDSMDWSLSKDAEVRQAKYRAHEAAILETLRNYKNGLLSEYFSKKAYIVKFGDGQYFCKATHKGFQYVYDRNSPRVKTFPNYLSAFIIANQIKLCLNKETAIETKEET